MLDIPAIYTQTLRFSSIPVVGNAINTFHSWWQQESLIVRQKKTELRFAKSIAEETAIGNMKGLFKEAKNYFDAIVLLTADFDQVAYQNKMFQPNIQKTDSLPSISRYLQHELQKYHEIAAKHPLKKIKKTISRHTIGLVVAGLSVGVGFTVILHGGLLPFYFGIVIGLLGLGLLLHSALALCEEKLNVNKVKMNQALNQLKNYNLLTDTPCELDSTMLEIYQQAIAIAKDQRQLCKNIYLVSLGVFAACLVGLISQPLPVLVPSAVSMFVGFSLMSTAACNHQETEKIFHALLRHQVRHQQKIPPTLVTRLHNQLSLNFNVGAYLFLSLPVKYLSLSLQGLIVAMMYCCQFLSLVVKRVQIPRIRTIVCKLPIKFLTHVRR